MQLSAANLLIAAQQVARQAPQAQATQASFASALTKEKPADGAFAPLDFKQTTAPARQEPAAVPTRPGAMLDIRV